MPIKIFRSDQLGAPTINGVSGSLITALDAILVNGYGQVSVTSISRSSSIATVVTGDPHGLATGDVALFAGAGQTEYNGEKQVTVLAPTSFTFAVAGEPATPATGSITTKRAPAGFSKVFAAANKGVYRSNDLSGLRNLYRVADNGLTNGGSREAVLHGFTSMTDMDMGEDQYPSQAMFSVGLYWAKSSANDTVGRHWVVVTDGKTVYFFNYIQAATNNTGSYKSIEVPGTDMMAVAFGDLIPFKPGDAYCSFATGNTETNQFSSTQYCGLFNGVTSITNIATHYPSGPQLYLPRDFTAAPGSRGAQVFGAGIGTLLGQGVYINYPHMIDNGFYMTPVLAVQGTPSLIRARVPGMYEPMHGPCFQNSTKIENIQGFPGRKFMMLYGKHGNSVGSLVFDITGPWDS